MKNELKNYGFIEPKIDKNHYIVGDGRLLGAAVLNPSGDWEKWLPVFEHQAKNFETYACTVFGLQSQVETMHKFLYGTEPNYDEKYNYNLANINPPGADPQITYETARRNGFIQGLLPMTSTLEEFRTPRPMTEPYLSEGKKWLSSYFFDHDWVLTGNESQEQRIKTLREELKKSPIGLSVTAWYEENGVYVDKGQSNTHWVELYKVDDYMHIFDSYDMSKKKLPFSHKTSYAKRIVFYKKTQSEVSWITKLINSFIQFFKDILK